MRVTVVGEGESHEGATPGGLQQYWVGTDEDLPDSGWRPRAIIGATSEYGLMLPDAKPSASTLYAPRGVWVDEHRTIVADTGNHRVLIFDGIPDSDQPEASVVLGQPDATSEGPQAGGRGPESGMNLPTGLLVDDDGRLLVADAWNHRILIWNEVPTADRPADLVLGQPDMSSIDPNAGGDSQPTPTSFYWPFGIALVDGRFYVADTGNRRVLVWTDGVPASADVPADEVLGQVNDTSREENAGGAAGANSFRWPHAVCGDGKGGVLVADAGDHRVLTWNEHPSTGQDADGVLGQPDMFSSGEFPYQVQKSTRFRFPYAMVRTGHGDLAVGDTANNRVIIWNGFPADQDSEAVAVLGQDSFAGNGENRWAAVTRDSLCWPYGLAAWENIIGVADSGNNRIVLWERER